MGSSERRIFPHPMDDEHNPPRASMEKMIDELVPEVRVSSESKELILNCCTEFIHMISLEANNVRKKSDKDTIKAEHVLKALDKLGFKDYSAEAEAVLNDCKAEAAKRRNECIRHEKLVKEKEELKQQHRENFEKAKAEIINEKPEHLMLVQVLGEVEEGTPLPFTPTFNMPKTEKEDDD